MRLLPPLFFACGYFLGGWAAIWLLVSVLGRGDPKLSGSVGFYYGLWICLYLPMAIMGTIALTKMASEFSKRMVASLFSLVALLAVMFVSFYFDVHFSALILEDLAIASAFWLITRIKSCAGQGVGGNSLPCLESKIEP